MDTADEQVEGLLPLRVGLKWYHVGFALAFGLGTAILPPTGTTTIAGWIGGAVGSLVTVSLLSGIVLIAVRSLDSWRPSSDVTQTAPDSRFIIGVFLILCIQLFIFGTQISVDLGLQAMLLLLAPLNVLVAALIWVDMSSLAKKGIDWQSTDYGYAVIALLVGFAGGLGYWYRRGRLRAAWVAEHEEPDEAAEESSDDEVSTEESVDTEEVSTEESVDTEEVSTEESVDTDEVSTDESGGTDERE